MYVSFLNCCKCFGHFSFHHFRWGVIEMYRKHKSKYLHCILYEDLAENPEKEISKLLHVLNIRSKNLIAAMEALKVIALYLMNGIG